MKIVDKIINLYFKFPTYGNLGLKVTGVFLLTLFILNGFDNNLVREVFD